MLQIETSQASQVFQPDNPSVGLTSLRLTGFSRMMDDSNRLIEYRSISLTSTAINGASQNSVAVLVRGVPGTYQMTATGQGDDDATYGAQFELVLGAPNNTPPGSEVENPIEIVNDETGESTSDSITFGEVTEDGRT